MKPQFLLVLLFAIGCKSPANKINDLATGMTKAQVIELLGAPSSTVAQDNFESLHYRLLRYRPPIRVPIHEAYDVQLIHGRVVAFGTPRELNKLAPPVANEKTVNVNINPGTNTLAPVQPSVNIKAD